MTDKWWIGNDDRDPFDEAIEDCGNPECPQAGNCGGECAEPTR